MAAAASSSSSTFPLLSLSSTLRHRSHRRGSHFDNVTAPLRVRSPLRAYRKSPNYLQDAVVVVPGPSAWFGDLGDGENDEDDDDEDEEEEDDRSLDLLARFVENIFRKISRRARKAIRSVLPPSISTKLVRFSVNGVLILAFLWILKAFLVVVCTVGSMVLAKHSSRPWSMVWHILHIMEHQYYHYNNRMDDNKNAWTGAQPAS